MSDEPPLTPGFGEAQSGLRNLLSSQGRARKRQPITPDMTAMADSQSNQFGRVAPGAPPTDTTGVRKSTVKAMKETEQRTTPAHIAIQDSSPRSRARAVFRRGGGIWRTVVLESPVQSLRGYSRVMKFRGSPVGKYGPATRQQAHCGSVVAPAHLLN